MAATSDEAEINGTRLRYRVAGTGPSIVFLHGFALDLRMWDEQVTAFAEWYRVIRYNLRGFGGSAMPGQTAYDHADDLRALLDHLGIATAAGIIGLSMGGEVALDFALAHPTRLRALVLADAMIGGYRWSAAWQAATAPAWRAARESGLATARERWLAHAGLFGPAHEQPRVAADLGRMVGDYSGWHWLNRDPRQEATPPAIERLAQISIPTLIVNGERDDPDFLAQATILRERISGARTATLPGVGHLANLEAPAAFNRAVIDFLGAVVP